MYEWTEGLVPLSSWTAFLPVIDSFQIDRYPCDLSQACFGHRGDWGPLMMAWSMALGAAALKDHPHLHNHEGITRDFLTDCISDISTLELEDEQNYYLIVADNSGVFEDVQLRLKLPNIQDTRTRDVQVLNEDWSREITYDEATGQWVIATHTMVFGDVNIWVIPKTIPGGDTDDP